MKKVICAILISSMLLTVGLTGCKKDKAGEKVEVNGTTKTTANGAINDKDNNDNDVDISDLTGEDNSKKTTKKGASSNSNSSDKGNTNNQNGETSGSGETTPSKETTTITTVKHDPDLATTNPKFTTNKEESPVPKTSAKGKQVDFSDADIQRLQTLVEMQGNTPYSYENSDGVPIELACKIAISMSEGLNEVPSGTVSLNLFTYFGQTIVGFKNKASAANAGVLYVSSSDTYKFTQAAEKSTVKLTKFYDLGKDNYYKATGTVTYNDNSKKAITIIIQKNKLDINYGFSVKAQKIG